MTITTSVNRYSYAGNGVTTAFAYSSRFLANADLVVLLVVTATGVSVTQVLTTNYTMTGAGDAGGGTITMLVAPPTGYTLIIYGDPSVTQETNLIENDALPAESLETAFDRLTLICARIKDVAARAFSLIDSSTSAASLVVPEPVANTIIGWDSAGTALQNYTASALDTSLTTPYTQTLLASADEAEARNVLGASSVGSDIFTAADEAAARSAIDAANSGANSDILSKGNNTSTIYTTGGTSTAYTITPVPAYTAYAAGMSFFVNFNAASGASPTLAVNGIATPPNLVKENPDGTYSNIRADDIPIDHRSRVTLISATQALVERMAANTTLGTPVTASGQTSINFTGIPSWAKSFYVSASGASLSGTADLLVQVGTSSGVATTGYSSGSFQQDADTTSTAGFIVRFGIASDSFSGRMEISLMDATNNTYAENHGGFRSGSGVSVAGGGAVSLAGVLDRIRITTSNGTDTFDAGVFNIVYSP